MEWKLPFKRKKLKQRSERSEGGIALFLVLSSMTFLSLLATEFTYIAQINKKIAYDGLAQAQATQLAKSAFKLSLLRLKGYQAIRALMDKTGQAGIPGLSNSMVDMIWSFPFIYPIPTNMPGMTSSQKESIKEFQEKSGLQGSFTAKISSESGKYNLNLLLESFNRPPEEDEDEKDNGDEEEQDEENEDDSGRQQERDQSREDKDKKGEKKKWKFDPEQARQNLFEFFRNRVERKAKNDREFADQYGHYNIRELVENIVIWADRGYKQFTPSFGPERLIPPKKAPFYHKSELHMVPMMTDKLYDLLAPSLTVSATKGINVNTAGKGTFKALIPKMREKEIKELLKYRDNPSDPHRFSKPEDFYKYLSNNVDAYYGGERAIKRLKKDFKERGIKIITSETEFQIYVEANVREAQKTLQARVSLVPEKANSAQGEDSGQQGQPSGRRNQPAPPQNRRGNNEDQLIDAKEEDPGIRVRFMRIL